MGARMRCMALGLWIALGFGLPASAQPGAGLSEAELMLFSSAAVGDRARVDEALNRGVEIAQDVADDPRNVILEQVTNGVAVRMALLYLVAGGVRNADAD